MLSPKRLYIFAGKGGVGKTTLALSMTKYLASRGFKVRYNAFYQETSLDLGNRLGLPVFQTTPLHSAETYIAKKLNSKTIASWIMKTHFFKSLFQMIPGLSHMILLGHVLDELEKNPELIIVMDSPASGHALTMFESSSNFKKIFRAGLIVKDIDRIHGLLSQKEFLKTIIVTLPTELAMSEALDLRHQLEVDTHEIKPHSEIVVNDSYLKYVQSHYVDPQELPPFLRNKIELEKALTQHSLALPHIAQTDPENVVAALAPLMEKCL